MSPTLDEAILRALQSVDTGANSKRNLEITLRYFGLDGNGGCSMQEAGSEYGITRESVRQITNKVVEKMDRSAICPELTERVLHVLLDVLPASAEMVEAVLVSKGYLSSGYKIEGALNAISLIKGPVEDIRLIRHNNARFVVRAGQEKLPKKIEGIAVSEISHNGAVSIDALSRALKGIGAETREPFARAVMGSIPETIWAGEQKRWALFVGRGRNRLLRRMELVFSVIERASEEHLQEGVMRNWKKNASRKTRVLDAPVIRDVLLATGSYELCDGMVSCLHPVDSKDALRDFDLKIYQMILASENLRCREKELEDALVLEGKDKWSFSVALNYCPLFMKHERGVYTLVGAPRSFG